jgi:hypothetical protein
MMRPTQSSASKASEKALTPPRKPTVALSVKKPANKADGKLPRVIRRFGPGPTAPAEGSFRAVATTPANQPAAEDEADAPVEEAVQSAETTGDQAPLPSNVDEPTTAQEIAPVVENIASAEEAIELAKEVEGEAELLEQPHSEEHTDEAAKNVATLVEQTEALSLEDAPETEFPEDNGHQKNEEVNEDSAIGEEDHVDQHQVTEASEK